jgi:8-oxo-dGTP pyrophosphatase MutT (NUDIX family)
MESESVLSAGPDGLGPDLPGLRRALFDPLDLTDIGDRIRGDFDLNPGLEPAERIRRAAVLVPLITREGGTTILFTQRTAHLAAHAGQISFPGGAVEPGDADERTTALRETQEEVGIRPEQVDLLGRLDPYLTRTGYRVTPFVGLVQHPVAIEADPYEVADVFEVPLDFLIDPANLQRHSRELYGKPRYFYAIPYGDRYIWGATAGMLVNLMEVFRRI